MFAATRACRAARPASTHSSSSATLEQFDRAAHCCRNSSVSEYCSRRSSTTGSRTRTPRRPPARGRHSRSAENFKFFSSSSASFAPSIASSRCATRPSSRSSATDSSRVVNNESIGPRCCTRASPSTFRGRPRRFFSGVASAACCPPPSSSAHAASPLAGRDISCSANRRSASAASRTASSNSARADRPDGVRAPHSCRSSVALRTALLGRTAGDPPRLATRARTTPPHTAVAAIAALRAPRTAIP
mmetsp:Transcript_3095/g.9629  ORF Transcript_3095/g.9629 Transcript_3095/m.9629 type:complete len:246 (+) Transcript_3095:1358-2095(+)